MLNIWNFYVEHSLFINLILTLFFGFYPIIFSRHSQTTNIGTVNIYIGTPCFVSSTNDISDYTNFPLWDRFWSEFSNIVNEFFEIFGIAGFSVLCTFLYFEKRIEVAAISGLIITITIIIVVVTLLRNAPINMIRFSNYIKYYCTVLFSIVSVYLWGRSSIALSHTKDIFLLASRLLSIIYIVIGIFLAVISALLSCRCIFLEIYGNNNLKRKLYIYLFASFISILFTSGILYEFILNYL